MSAATDKQLAEFCLRGACLAWSIDPSEETMRTLAELCDTLAKARRAIVRGREAMPGSRVFAMLDSLRADKARDTMPVPPPVIRTWRPSSKPITPSPSARRAAT